MLTAHQLLSIEPATVIAGMKQGTWNVGEGRGGADDLRMSLPRDVLVEDSGGGIENPGRSFSEGECNMGN